MTVASAARAQLGRELAAIVGKAYVCEDAGPLTGFAIDGVLPALWVLPGSAEEIAAVIRLANERDATVTVAGGFTRQSMGNVPRSVDILLRTDRLNRVLHFDPGDLTIGVETGCRIAHVQKEVGGHSLLLPLDVAKGDIATIGGTLATASLGPLKHGFGGVREYCIGISFVTGDGRIAKAGGRVVKNVAGYDLMRLMIRSQGTLGIITAANFKLFPAPRQTATFAAEFDSSAEALMFRDAVRHSPLTPLCLELVSPGAHAYVDGSSRMRWMVAVRASGSEAVLGRYRRELGNAQELAGEHEERFWAGVREFAETVVHQHQNAMLMEVHLPPNCLSEWLATSQQGATDNNFLFSCIGRTGLASMIAAFVPLSVDPPAAMQYANAAAAIRSGVPKDGAAIVVRCPREAKSYLSVWGSSLNNVEAMKRVKKALDPNGVLNRGRFLF